jgi:ABC-type multidrug transport system fused ATPase/permease subunit
VYHTTTFLGGVAVGLYFSWQLTLVCLAFVPILGLSVLWIKHRSDGHERMLSDSYKSAGAVVSEALTCIRTVMAFGSQRREIASYMLKLKPSEVRSARAGGWSRGWRVRARRLGGGGVCVCATAAAWRSPWCPHPVCVCVRLLRLHRSRAC